MSATGGCLSDGIARLVGQGSDKFSKCIGSFWFDKFGQCGGFCRTGGSVKCSMLGESDKVCKPGVSGGFNNLSGPARVADLAG